VEICARLAMELGGGAPILHDPNLLYAAPDPSFSPILGAADLVVRMFCVGEAFSLPQLRGSYRCAKHPLPRAAHRRIVRDEVAHATFGFAALDWLSPRLSGEDRRTLARSANRALEEIAALCDAVKQRPRATPEEANLLGWMDNDAYSELAARTIRDKIVTPLRARGLDVDASRAGALYPRLEIP